MFTILDKCAVLQLCRVAPGVISFALLVLAWASYLARRILASRKATKPCVDRAGMPYSPRNLESSVILSGVPNYGCLLLP
jgi:hypothetical protein